MEQMTLEMQDHTGGMTDDNTKRKDCTLPGTSSYILLRWTNWVFSIREESLKNNWKSILLITAQVHLLVSQFGWWVGLSVMISKKSIKLHIHAPIIALIMSLPVTEMAARM